MSRYYASSPVDFLCPHQDENAMINAHFSAGTKYHSCFLDGAVKLEKLLQEHREKIVDTRFRCVNTKLLKAYKNESEDRFDKTYAVDGEYLTHSIALRGVATLGMNLNAVIFDFSSEGNKAFISLEANGSLTWRIRLISESLEMLNSMVFDFMGDYYIDDGVDKGSRDKPKLGVLQVTLEGIHVEEVDLNENRVMETDVLEMHFGSEILDLQIHIKNSLANHDSGLHLFQGQAGTGKTSFLNHLTAELAETHRLIYIPVSAFSSISSPESIGFWINLAKRQKHGKKNVLIVEDAEGLVQSRDEIDTGQASVVSTLLNLSDGLLGNILNLHLIATINTDHDNIDSALLRAGRLRTYHEFKALDQDQARRLADHLGVNLSVPDEGYTLAEIYNGQSKKGQKEEGVIGFQVPA